MKIHANAPFGPKGRLTMVRRVLEQEWSLTEAAEEYLEGLQLVIATHQSWRTGPGIGGVGVVVGSHEPSLTVLSCFIGA